MRYLVFDHEGNFLADIADKSLGIPQKGQEIPLKDGTRRVISEAFKEQIHPNEFSLVFPVVVE